MISGAKTMQVTTARYSNPKTLAIAQLSETKRSKGFSAETKVFLLASNLYESVGYDSLNFKNDALAIELRFGQPATHGIHYNLHTDTDNFGELVLTRDTPFTESELEVVEKGLTILAPNLTDFSKL